MKRAHNTTKDRSVQGIRAAARMLPRVGSVVDIWWDDRDTAFRGKLMRRVGTRKWAFDVAYDDGDRHVHDLNDRTWRFATDGACWHEPGDIVELVRECRDSSFFGDTPSKRQRVPTARSRRSTSRQQEATLQKNDAASSRTSDASQPAPLSRTALRCTKSQSQEKIVSRKQRVVKSSPAPAVTQPQHANVQQVESPPCIPPSLDAVSASTTAEMQCTLTSVAGSPVASPVSAQKRLTTVSIDKFAAHVDDGNRDTTEVPQFGDLGSVPTTAHSNVGASNAPIQKQQTTHISEQVSSTDAARSSPSSTLIAAFTMPAISVDIPSEKLILPITHVENQVNYQSMQVPDTTLASLTSEPPGQSEAADVGNVATIDFEKQALCSAVTAADKGKCDRLMEKDQVDHSVKIASSSKAPVRLLQNFNSLMTSKKPSQVVSREGTTHFELSPPSLAPASPVSVTPREDKEGPRRVPLSVAMPVLSMTPQEGKAEPKQYPPSLTTPTSLLTLQENKAVSEHVPSSSTTTAHSVTPQEDNTGPKYVSLPKTAGASLMTPQEDKKELKHLVFASTTSEPSVKLQDNKEVELKHSFPSRTPPVLLPMPQTKEAQGKHFSPFVAPLTHYKMTPQGNELQAKRRSLLVPSALSWVTPPEGETHVELFPSSAELQAFSSVTLQDDETKFKPSSLPMVPLTHSLPEPREDEANYQLPTSYRVRTAPSLLEGQDIKVHAMNSPSSIALMTPLVMQESDQKDETRPLKSSSSTLPSEIQKEGDTSPLHPSPSTKRLLTLQQGDICITEGDTCITHPPSLTTPKMRQHNAQARPKHLSLSKTPSVTLQESGTPHTHPQTSTTPSMLLQDREGESRVMYPPLQTIPTALSLMTRREDKEQNLQSMPCATRSELTRTNCPTTENHTCIPVAPLLNSGSGDGYDGSMRLNNPVESSASVMVRRHSHNDVPRGEEQNNCAQVMPPAGNTNLPRPIQTEGVNDFHQDWSVFRGSHLPHRKRHGLHRLIEKDSS